MIKRIELLEGQQKRATTEKRLDQFGERVETLELDQQESQNAQERFIEKLTKFEKQIQQGFSN